MLIFNSNGNAQAAVEIQNVTPPMWRVVLSNPSLSPELKLLKLKEMANSERELAWALFQLVTQHFKHDQRIARQMGDPSTYSLADLFEIGSGSCAVFANVLHRLYQMAGFRIRTVEGTVFNGSGAMRHGRLVNNHVWNQVFLDGQWYVLDATWGAGVLTDQGFRREPNPLFFLMPEESAVLNYYDPADSLGLQARYGVDAQTFSRLAGEALYVKARGFTTDAILNHVKRAANRELVTTFDQPPDAFKVFKAPVGRLLHPGPVEFELQSTVYEEVWIVQGKVWTRLGKRSGFFHKNYEADKGELLVMGRRPKSDELEALLAYTVR